MKIQLLNGKVEKLNLRKYPLREQSRSNFQSMVGQLLKQIYPMDTILEEVYISGEKLIFDFFIPSLRLVIECNGIQHNKFVQFFHGTLRVFHNQQDRDNRKRRLCAYNNLRLIEISSQMSRDEIKQLLENMYVKR